MAMWDDVKLQQFSLPMDFMGIKKIQPSPRFGSNFLGWAPKKTRQFSVKSAYKLAYNELHDASISSSNTNIQGGGTYGKLSGLPSPPPQKVLSFGWGLATNTDDLE